MNEQESTQSDPSPERSKLWWLKPLTNAGLLLAAGVLVIFLLGLAQNFDWIQTGGGGASTQASGEQVTYTCPMHPNIRQNSPASCPICGMPLEPIRGTTDKDPRAIRIEPAARRLANIQTATAELKPVHRKIRAVGAITYAEGQLATIAAYVAGRIERLFADYTGVMVSKGDDLVTLYSPELFEAQTSYLVNRKMFAGSTSGGASRFAETSRELADAARQNLIELGMTEEQVQELESSGKARSRIKIYAPIGGTVIGKPVVEGQYVKTGDVIYRIADLSTVWLTLELFPEDATHVRYGQRVETEVQSLPGQIFTGRVAFVDPVVNTRTRTVGVRVVMTNEQGQLRPGDYAKATINVPIGTASKVFDEELAGKWISPRHPQIIRDEPGKCPLCGIDMLPVSEFGYADEPLPESESLVIPRDAVLSMANNSIVYVETEPGRFEIRSVVLGPFVDNEAVILQGLEPGEQVATSGNFLIDSQMQLAGKPSLIDPTRFIPKADIREQDQPAGPLTLGAIEVQGFPGPVSEDLERLYQAYFAIGADLAADKTASGEHATALHDAAKRLAASSELPKNLVEIVQSVVGPSEHLHHQEIAKAREDFKPISQAVVRLAAQARGTGAKRPFIHFYCPMVEGGGGDWLQATGPLANPYFGSQMLHCGEQVHTLPAAGTEADHHHNHNDHGSGTKEEPAP